jgi:hypothetical protein
VQHRQIRLQPTLGDFAAGDRCLHGAILLAVVQAAAVGALGQQRADLREQELQLLRAHAEQVEAAHARRVEHVAATGQGQQLRVGRRVPSLSAAVQVTGAQLQAGHHGIEQRGLAGTRQTDDHRAVCMQQQSDLAQRATCLAAASVDVASTRTSARP